MIFPQFSLLQFDVISLSFAYMYQDDGLHITSFSTLHANILRTKSDIEKQLREFFLFLSDLTPKINMFLGELSLLTVLFAVKCCRSFVLLHHSR